MTTYLERFALVRDAQFHQRLQMAIWTAAVAILDAKDSTEKAKAYAAELLKGEASTETFRSMSIRCAASGMGRDATDEAVQAIVDQVVAERAV